MRTTLTVLERPLVTTADLIERYQQTDWNDEADTGDHALNPDHAGEFMGLARREAAVLVPVIDRPEATILLTVRAKTLRKHAGQIAFPGGSTDPGESAIDAALREANEEVGLRERHVKRIVGPLPRYATGSGFRVTPIVAVIDPSFTPHPAPAEVADTFEVPLRFVLDPESFQIGETEWRGRLRRYYAMHYASDGTERRIWGVTAGILRAMAVRLSGASARTNR